MNNDILDSKDKFLVKPQKSKFSIAFILLIALFLIGIGAFVFVRKEVKMEVIEQKEMRATESRLMQQKQELQDSLNSTAN